VRSTRSPKRSRMTICAPRLHCIIIAHPSQSPSVTATDQVCSGARSSTRDRLNTDLALQVVLRHDLERAGMTHPWLHQAMGRPIRRHRPPCAGHCRIRTPSTQTLSIIMATRSNHGTGVTCMERFSGFQWCFPKAAPRRAALPHLVPGREAEKVMLDRQTGFVNPEWPHVQGVASRKPRRQRAGARIYINPETLPTWSRRIARFEIAWTPTLTCSKCPRRARPRFPAGLAAPRSRPQHCLGLADSYGKADGA